MVVIAADYFSTLTTTLQNLDSSQLARLHRLVAACRDRDGTLWIAGNGGSYATAAHLAADLTKAGGMRAQQLASNAALLTAVANDTTYAEVFAAELARYARAGDALLLLSVSGTSGNVLVAWRDGQTRQLPTALITACPAPVRVDALVQVRAQDYGIVEDVTSAIGHWLIAALGER